MKTPATLFACALLATAAGLAQARDIGPDQAMKLVEAGTIQPFDKLNAAVLASYPGATLRETELELEHGRHIYQVELRDAQGVRRELHLDAASGEVLDDREDD